MNSCGSVGTFADAIDSLTEDDKQLPQVRMIEMKNVLFLMCVCVVLC
jgi:hypothetical protein